MKTIPGSQSVATSPAQGPATRPFPPAATASTAAAPSAQQAAVSGNSCNRVFVRFYYVNGGDTTFDLRQSGVGGWENVTGTVKLYVKNGAAVLIHNRPNADQPGYFEWSRTDACSLGGGFTLTAGSGAPIVTVVEAY